MRDNGINVIIGQWEGDKVAWDKAVADGWVPGKTLFGLEEQPIAAPSSSTWSPTLHR